MQSLIRLLRSHFGALRREEDGAIGWLIVGIVIGAVVIIVLLVQLVIPGDGD
jgi:hypothetical protein